MAMIDTSVQAWAVENVERFIFSERRMSNLTCSSQEPPTSRA